MVTLLTQAGDGPASLPWAERDAQLRAEDEAEALAAGGKIASGFMRLARGLQYARDREDRGTAWGHELARLYQAAMVDYADRYGLWLKRSDPA